jgi:hypothetical protein
MPRQKAKRLTPAERLVKNKIVDMATGCWISTYAADKNHYPSITVAKRVIAAHRFAYEAFIGPIPQSKEIRHLCHQKHCINPGHLSVGTHQENMEDYVRFKLENSTRAPNTQHKLSVSDVLCVQRLLESGKTTTEIAQIFDVTRDHIGRIRNKGAWKFLRAN